MITITLANITDTATAEGARKAYADGDAKAKASIRSTVDRIMKEAIDALDMAKAKAAKDLLASLVTARPTAEGPNYAMIVGMRVAALRAAADMIESGAIMPEGITAEMMAPGAWALDKIDPKADDMIRDAARKIAGTKITKSGDRRDIGEWIERAFEGIPVGGRLTVAQIITRGAIEGDDYRPSAGAVKNRLVGGSDGCTVPGVTGDDTPGKAYGGIRTAE